MIDHLELKTTKLEASADFYEHILEPLGYRRQMAGEAIGFADGTGYDFFLVDGDPASDAHFAFRAQSRGLVNGVYERGRDAGFILDRAPALAPHIHPNYYAGYLRDPDDRLVEIVCHEAE